MNNAPKYIIIHHTADNSTEKQFTKVDEYHKQNGFPLSSFGFFCGYHYFIDRDGSVTHARADTDEGAHTKGHNYESIGIGVAGNYNTERISAISRQRLGELINQLAKKYKISVQNIKPHRSFSNTSCPGANIADNFGQIAMLENELTILQKLLQWLKIKLGL